MKNSVQSYKPQSCNALLSVALLFAAGEAAATEGGSSNYPQGAESYLAAAAPPPGVYGLAYALSYASNTLRDDQGARVPANFNLHLNIVATRLIWIREEKLLGGQVMLHTILPVVSVGGSLGGRGGGDSGLGNVDVGAGLAYHLSPKFHYGFAMDAFAPTGRYSKNELFNVAPNYWTFQPIAAFTYMQPAGVNADLKLMTDINRRNPANDYRSGTAFHADYVLAWAFNSSIAAGVGGFVYEQFTDDRAPGLTAPNRGRAVGIGPNFKYDNGKGWFIALKYQRDYRVRNRPSGSGLYVKAAIPL